MQRAAFRIGHEPTSHLTITHACNPTRKVQNYGSNADSACHDFRVEAAVPGFRANLTFEMHLSGISKSGHVEWTVTLRCIDGIDVNQLTFSLHEDQSYLPQILSQVDALLSEARAEPREDSY